LSNSRIAPNTSPTCVFLHSPLRHLIPVRTYRLMTEYDYSPAAYDRYMRTQNRVSNWVSDSNAHERQYSNPFVPSVANGGASASSSHISPSHHGSQKVQSSGSNHVATIKPRDINGTVVNGASIAPPTSPQEAHGSRSGSRNGVATARPSHSGDGGSQRSRTLDAREFRGSQLSSRSSQNRSFSNPHEYGSASRSQSHYSHPPTHHSQSQSHSTGSHHPSGSRSGSASEVVYKSYDRDGSSIHLPAPRPGETLVIIPHRRRVDMVSSTGSVVSVRI